MSDVRFVRIHGRIVPIRAKGGAAPMAKPVSTAVSTLSGAIGGAGAGAIFADMHLTSRLSKILTRRNQLMQTGGHAAFNRAVALTEASKIVPRDPQAAAQLFKKMFATKQAVKVFNRAQDAVNIVKKARGKALLVGAGIGLAAGALYGFAGSKLTQKYWANKKK